MGRPKLADGRREFVSVRFTAAELARVERAARMAEMDVSAFVRLGALALVDEVEIDQGIKAPIGLPPMVEEGET